VTPPSWHPDPHVPGQLRWWDGSTWTTHVAANPDPAAIGIGAPPVPAGTRRPAVVFAIVAVAVVAAVVATARLTSPNRPVAAAPDRGLADRASAAQVPLLDREGAVTHTHTLVRVLVDGADHPVPASIGRNAAGGQIAAVHTHDRSGIVHVESPRANDTYTVGQFLELWGAGRDHDEVCATVAGAPCDVAVVVVAPTAEDRALFANYGPMPTIPALAAADLDTELAQGAVIEVRLSTQAATPGIGRGGATSDS
jgi:hypothetical protein